jgi:hypothetical protein
LNKRVSNGRWARHLAVDELAIDNDLVHTVGAETVLNVGAPDWLLGSGVAWEGAAEVVLEKWSVVAVDQWNVSSSDAVVDGACRGIAVGNSDLTQSPLEWSVSRAECDANSLLWLGG